MITVPSAVSRELSDVFRRLGRGRVRTDVVFEWSAGLDGLTLQAVGTEVAVRYHVPGRRPETQGTGSLDVLATPSGSTESNVTLRPSPRRNTKPFPAEPKRFTPVPGLWAALAAAASVTARESESRFVLNRIQLRGGRKAIVASDSKQLLVQSGFALPWSDDVLVPSSEVFAALAGRTPPETAVARTPGHVFIRSGPWTVALTIDCGGRFPNVDPLLVRGENSGSELIVGEADRARLVKEIPRLPYGGREAGRSITLDLAGPVVRASEAGGSATSIRLPQSRVQGRRVAVTCDRAYLLAALKLGFTRMRISTADQPLVWHDDRRTYLFLPLAGCKPSRSTSAPTKPPVTRVPSRSEPKAPSVVPKTPVSKSPPPTPVHPRPMGSSLSVVTVKTKAHRSRRRPPQPEPGLWSGIWSRVRSVFRAK